MENSGGGARLQGGLDNHETGEKVMVSLVFNFVRYSKGSIIASNRIAGYIAEQEGLNVVDYTTIEKYDGTKVDRLYIVNGAYAFCPCLEELSRLINSAKKIIWAQNDYTI